MKLGKYSIYFFICFFFNLSQSFSEAISDIKIEDLKDLPSTYEEIEEFEDQLTEIEKEITTSKEITSESDDEISGLTIEINHSNNLLEEENVKLKEQIYDPDFLIFENSLFSFSNENLIFFLHKLFPSL